MFRIKAIKTKFTEEMWLSTRDLAAFIGLISTNNHLPTLPQMVLEIVGEIERPETSGTSGTFDGNCIPPTACVKVNDIIYISIKDITKYFECIHDTLT